MSNALLNWCEATRNEYLLQNFVDIFMLVEEPKSSDVSPDLYVA